MLCIQDVVAHNEDQRRPQEAPALQKLLPMTSWSFKGGSGTRLFHETSPILNSRDTDFFAFPSRLVTLPQSPVSSLYTSLSEPPAGIQTTRVTTAADNKTNVSLGLMFLLGFQKSMLSRSTKNQANSIEGKSYRTASAGNGGYRNLTDSFHITDEAKSKSHSTGS